MFKNLSFQITLDFADSSYVPCYQHEGVWKPRINNVADLRGLQHITSKGGWDLPTRRRPEGLLARVQELVQQRHRVQASDLCKELDLPATFSNKMSVGMCMKQLGWTNQRNTTRAARKTAGRAWLRAESA